MSATHRVPTRSTGYARNAGLEVVLGRLTDALGPSAAAAAARYTEPRHPVILIVGPPRSGSTFLLQRLAATGSFGYPSNLVSRFHSAPFVGALAHRLLLDPELDHRGEMSRGLSGEIPRQTEDTAGGPDGLSTLGKTTGPANVNEFWYAWRAHLPSTASDDMTLDELNRIDHAGLRAMAAGLEAGFERPVAMKALILSFHAELLAEMFPTAVFLRLDRDPAETVDSILAARRVHNEDPSAWWSLRPRDIESLQRLPPVDQVAHQVTAIEDALDRAMPRLEPRALRVDAALLRDDPRTVDASIADFLDGFGVDVNTAPMLAAGTPRTLGRREMATITAALDRARAQRAQRSSVSGSAEPPTTPIPVTNPARPDVGEEADDHLLLYTTRTFATRNLGPSDRWLRTDLIEDDRVVGTLSGALTTQDGRRLWWSGHSAPFGGPSFTRDQVTPSVVDRLLDQAATAAAAEGAERMRVTLRPASYSASEPLVLHTLLQHGFSVVGSELSCAIDLRSLATRDDYVASLKRAARRALHKTLDQPWDFVEITGTWEEQHELLQRNRARKDRSIRLPLSYLQQLREDVPGALRFFELRHDGRPVAAAILYRLLPHVESVQYWGDDADWLPFSPMRQLALEVATLSIEEGRRLLDLGKSSVDGAPDHGLVQFKRSIGAVAEPIITLERTLR